MGRFRDRISYANVTATLALFVALGGSAYAVEKIGSRDIEKNAIKSKHLKNAGVKAPDLAIGAVNSAEVADGSLLEEDFLAGQLPQGERGPQGPQGPEGPQGDPATRLFAVVQANGDLNYGSGAVSATRTGEGNYRVGFNRSLVGCAAVANTGRGNPLGSDTTQVGSTATVDMTTATEGEMLVSTTGFGTTGLADRSFLLAVFC